MFKELSDRLKALRVQNGYTRKQVSELVSISVSMVGFYESGERLPSLPILVRLAGLYKVSVDYLLGVNTDSRETLSLEGLTDDQMKAVRLTVECFHNVNDCSAKTAVVKTRDD